MSIITKEQLVFEAQNKDYRPEILEKVYRLLDLLEAMMSVTFLKERLALKGGTAINLFCSDQLPRLSVDLDFNYVGSVERDLMLQDKEEINQIILRLCQSKRYELHRNPRTHAGGKMVLVYNSLLGTKGRLELDLNYLYRSPLWKVQWLSSADWPKRTGVTVLDIHELAAGKLHALLSRSAARDLFDSHRLLKNWTLDKDKLRVAFTVYAGMRKNSWKDMNTALIQFDIKDIRNKLIPVLQKQMIPGTKHHEIQAWCEKMLVECRDAFSSILPFHDNEIKFLSHLEKGEIKPEFLSNNPEFCQSVVVHPALIWKINR